MTALTVLNPVSNVVNINSPRTRLVHPDHITSINTIYDSVETLTPLQRWEVASESAMDKASTCRRLLAPILELTAKGVSDRYAIESVITHLESGGFSDEIQNIASNLSQKHKATPARSTFSKWLKAYREDGLPGLLTKHKGRVRKEYGWEIQALRLFHIPSKPGYADVAVALKRFDLHATPKQVARFIQSLPAEYGPESPWRLGNHYYRQNVAGYVRMAHESLDVGQIYQGDGHTCDAYIEHPHSGHLFRAELTVWIDVASHYIVAHHISAAESAETTLYALSDALVSHDHVPEGVHVDNGSGFINKMMSGKSTGFYQRMGITVKRSIPGNSKGKGLVERWFGIFRNRHDKFWNGGKDYCGHDQSPDTNRRIIQELKNGSRKLLHYSLYQESVAAFIDEFNHTPQQSLNGKSPAELWSTLEHNRVELPAAAVVRPQEERTVSREQVQFSNRYYKHPQLRSYSKQEVIIEYDMHDDSKVWIYNKKHQFICEAPLVGKRDWAAGSISEDRQKKREQGRINRVIKKAQLIRAEEQRQLEDDALINMEEIEQRRIKKTAEYLDQQEPEITIDLNKQFMTEGSSNAEEGITIDIFKEF